MDDDPKQTLSYRLLDDYQVDRESRMFSFRLNEHTGELLLSGDLDRETLAEGRDVTLKIEVSDDGVPRLKDGCLVHVDVIDLNDNPPTISVEQV